MTATQIYSVARKVEALTPDADLLARYTREQNHSCFEELVRRHGPLVWNVCRHLLPDRADAEDAFQAVFLALVRSGHAIRDGHTLPAWLHGVAVRIATRAKREFARRKARERAAARPEAARPIADGTWEALVRAAHEEVQRLPEAERTAFVLCDLEGVSQSDAAARLGWPLGSLSGRLCRARQRLLDRLSARGIAPAAAVGIGLTTGTASAVPGKLLDTVKVLSGAPGAASAAATALARGLTEGVTMRLKLMTTATVVVASLGLTGGAALLSQADAQPPEVIEQVKRLLGTPEGQEPPQGPGGGAPGAGMMGPGMAAGSTSGGFGTTASSAVDYKFVDIRSDRKVFEAIVTQQGKEGWELCGSERFGPAELTLVFKKTKAVGAGGSGSGFRGSAGSSGTSASGEPVNPEHNWATLQRLTNSTGDTVDLSKIPQQTRAMLRNSTERLGGLPLPETGIWTKERFFRYLADNEAQQTTASNMRWHWDIQLKHIKAQTAVAAIQKIISEHDYGSQFQTPGVYAHATKNAITVEGPLKEIDVLRKLVEDLDVETAKEAPGMGAPPSAGPMGAPLQINDAPVVLELKYASATDIEPVLKKVFPDAQITGELRTNKLIVRADAKTRRELTELIEKLDVNIKNQK